MKTIILRPAEPECDFGQLAAWFTSLEDEPTSEPGLKEYYERQRKRIIQMAAKDEQGELYDEIIARLKSEGFQFTSMEELGNTEEARRKLYILNETTGIEIPGAGTVVIDTATGDWAAMSAITRMEGNDYAYNLHTGVDRPLFVH